MQLQEVIARRKSIREYSDKDILPKDLEQIINSARLAPTARNDQPWEFIVVTDKDTKYKIGTIASPNGAFIAEAAACIGVFCLETKYYLEDGCAATENIILSACDLGIGSCWVAGEKKPYCEEIKRLLKVPERYRLISLISLGYPKDNPKTKPKRTLEEVLHWQKF